MIKKPLKNSDETEALGQWLAQHITEQVIIYLYGDLGAGKTTLVRGFLRALGHKGAVKSPTYTLVEPYDMGILQVYHFDLYRLADPEELEYMGIRDYLQEKACCLIEWPDQGGEFTPPADISVHLSYQEEGRDVMIQARSELGAAIVQKLVNN